MTGRAFAFAVLITVAAMGGGCGYRLAGAEGIYRDDVRSVAVPVVGNRTFHRSDTTQLTDALVRQVESQTPYRVARAEQADTLLEVTITDIRRSSTSRNRGTGLPEEQLYVVTADFVWKDLRTGAVLVRRENFEQTATLYATLGESDFIAAQDAAEQLAAGIVGELTEDW